MSNAQRDIAPREHYEKYIGAAQEHDGKTDNIEEWRHLGQIPEMISRLLNGFGRLGSFLRFEIFIGEFSSVEGGDSNLHISQQHHNCPKKHGQHRIKKFRVVNSHAAPVGSMISG